MKWESIQVSKMPLTLQLSPKKTKKNFTLAGLLSDKDHCLSNYIFDVNFTSKRDKATTIVNQNRECVTSSHFLQSLLSTTKHNMCMYIQKDPLCNK